MRARLVLLALLMAGGAGAQRFYPDDPLLREPPPLDAGGILRRKLSDIYAYIENTFWHPGDRSRRPALAVNTLGEPMDGAWYTHRHYFRRMSLEELARGPDGRTPPADGPWTLIKVKNEGIMPGFTIVDRANRVYLLKLDPRSNLEMATAADVVSSKFFHAFGYNVPDQYIAYFDPPRLVIARNVRIADPAGHSRNMTRRDLLDLLKKTGTDRKGRYRAIASREIPGEEAGPFRFFGTRTDDPNDIVPHEDRRDLRGMYVFCSWIDHSDSKANNTYDALVRENGAAYLRHYLIDFGTTLGSASIGPKSVRSGNEPLFAWTPALRNMFTLGFYAPEWMRWRYPKLPSVGRFASETFYPDRWVPEYPNAAFENRLPDDEFWAAKQVMAFTDADIRAIVHTGVYSNPAAEDYIVRILAGRRDKIGRTYLERVLPLDRFEVRNGRLVFDDLGLKYGLVKSRDLKVVWSGFDNATGARTPVKGATDFAVPAAGDGYLVADIAQAGDDRRTINVYLRKQRGGVQVVGVDRHW